MTKIDDALKKLDDTGIGDRVIKECLDILPGTTEEIAKRLKIKEDSEEFRELMRDDRFDAPRTRDGTWFLTKFEARKRGIIVSTEEYVVGNKFITKNLADDILKSIHIITLKGNDKMYRYHKGLYVDDGKEFVKEICVNLLLDDYSIRRFHETISYIQGRTYRNPKEIDSGWINLENGLLNPITGKFKEHTPEVFSIARIPIVYDPKADCPLFRRKLKEKVSKELYLTVQEMFGYCYLPGQKFEKAFMCYGPPRTMKSTTLFALEKILGKENISANTIQGLNDNTFSSAYLYGKVANICADLSTQSLKETGMFMKIVGGDPISVAKKGEHEITFHPSAKLIFSCNTIPPTHNKNPAFYRRWLPMKFNKQTPMDEVDTDMRKKILKELPGILNWAMEGLKRLLKNDGFTIRFTDDEIKDIYERHSDTIASFIFNTIDCEHDEGVLVKREVYKEYIQYCRSINITPENVIKFGRMFKAHTGCGICKKGGIPAYSGVNFKDRETDQKTLGGRA